MNCFRILILLIIYVYVSMTVVNSQKYVAVVKPGDGNDYGYIDEYGDFILPPVYKYGYNFTEYGLGPIYDNIKDEVYYINLKGDTVLRSNSKYNLIKPIGGGMSVPNISDSLLRVEKDDKYGFINLKGEIVIEELYDTITPFNNGYAVVNRNNRYYLIDKKGSEQIIEDKNIKNVQRINEGLAVFEDDRGKFGYINTDGKVIIEAKYKNAQLFLHGLAGVRVENGNWGFINKSGEFVIQPVYTTVFPFFEEGYTVVIDRFNVEQLIKNNGEIVRVKDKKIFPPFHDGLILARKTVLEKKHKDDRSYHGFIDGTGEWKIYPEFSYADYFSNGYAPARKDGLIGYIDKFGVWQIEPKYISVGPMVKIMKPQKDSLMNKSYDFNDIVNYLSVIKGLDVKPDLYVGNNKVNLSQYSNSVYLTYFYEEDRNFLSWLTTFSSDTVNIGLWEHICKGKELTNIEVVDNSEINDSKLALYFINWFLLKDEFNGKNSIRYSFDMIKEIISNSNNGISEIRSELKANENKL